MTHGLYQPKKLKIIMMTMMIGRPRGGGLLSRIRENKDRAYCLGVGWAPASPAAGVSDSCGHLGGGRREAVAMEICDVILPKNRLAPNIWLSFWSLGIPQILCFP